MAEAVTQAQFFSEMQKLDERLQDSHRRQREHIDVTFGKLEAAFERHEDEDKAVEKRVTRIEEERRAESNAIAKLSAMTSAIVTSVLYVGASLMKKLFQ